MIVIDASIAIKWFVREEGHVEAISLLRSEHQLIAPDFVLLEVANVLRRKCKRGELSEDQWRQAVDALPGYFDRLLPLRSLMRSAVDLAIELDHAVYDCVYLACAIALGTAVATADASFVRKVEGTARRAQILRHEGL